LADLKRIVLDVLKPHQPNVLALSNALADLGEDYRVSVEVDEVDEKTETVVVEIEGDRLDFERIEQTIRAVGGSLHSIDKVLVWGETPGASEPGA
jgi:hypothetical protein